MKENRLHSQAGFDRYGEYWEHRLIHQEPPPPDEPKPEAEEKPKEEKEAKDKEKAEAEAKQKELEAKILEGLKKIDKSSHREFLGKTILERVKDDAQIQTDEAEHIKATLELALKDLDVEMPASLLSHSKLIHLGLEAGLFGEGVKGVEAYEAAMKEGMEKKAAAERKEEDKEAPSEKKRTFRGMYLEPGKGARVGFQREPITLDAVTEELSKEDADLRDVYEALEAMRKRMREVRAEELSYERAIREQTHTPLRSAQEISLRRKMREGGRRGRQLGRNLGHDEGLVQESLQAMEGKRQEHLQRVQQLKAEKIHLLSKIRELEGTLKYREKFSKEDRATLDEVREEFGKKKWNEYLASDDAKRIMEEEGLKITMQRNPRTGEVVPTVVENPEAQARMQAEEAEREAAKSRITPYRPASLDQMIAVRYGISMPPPIRPRQFGAHASRYVYIDRTAGFVPHDQHLAEMARDDGHSAGAISGYEETQETLRQEGVSGKKRKAPPYYKGRPEKLDFHPLKGDIRSGKVDMRPWKNAEEAEKFRKEQEALRGKYTNRLLGDYIRTREQFDELGKRYKNHPQFGHAFRAFEKTLTDTDFDTYYSSTEFRTQVEAYGKGAQVENIMERNREKMRRTGYVEHGVLELLKMPEMVQPKSGKTLTIAVSKGDKNIVYHPRIVERFADAQSVEHLADLGIDFENTYLQLQGYRQGEEGKAKLKDVLIRFSQPGKYEVTYSVSGFQKSATIEVHHDQLMTREPSLPTIPPPSEGKPMSTEPTKPPSTPTTEPAPKPEEKPVSKEPRVIEHLSKEQLAVFIPYVEKLSAELQKTLGEYQPTCDLTLDAPHHLLMIERKDKKESLVVTLEMWTDNTVRIGSAHGKTGQHMEFPAEQLEQAASVPLLTEIIVNALQLKKRQDKVAPAPPTAPEPKSEPAPAKPAAPEPEKSEPEPPPAKTLTPAGEENLRKHRQEIALKALEREFQKIPKYIGTLEEGNLRKLSLSERPWALWDVRLMLKVLNEQLEQARGDGVTEQQIQNYRSQYSTLENRIQNAEKLIKELNDYESPPKLLERLKQKLGAILDQCQVEIGFDGYDLVLVEKFDDRKGIFKEFNLHDYPKSPHEIENQIYDSFKSFLEKFQQAVLKDFLRWRQFARDNGMEIKFGDYGIIDVLVGSEVVASYRIRYDRMEEWSWEPVQEKIQKLANIRKQVKDRIRSQTEQIAQRMKGKLDKSLAALRADILELYEEWWSNAQNLCKDLLEGLTSEEQEMMIGPHVTSLRLSGLPILLPGEIKKVVPELRPFFEAIIQLEEGRPAEEIIREMVNWRNSRLKDTEEKPPPAKPESGNKAPEVPLYVRKVVDDLMRTYPPSERGYTVQTEGNSITVTKTDVLGIRRTLRITFEEKYVGKSFTTDEQGEEREIISNWSQTAEEFKKVLGDRVMSDDVLWSGPAEYIAKKLKLDQSLDDQRKHEKMIQEKIDVLCRELNESYKNAGFTFRRDGKMLLVEKAGVEQQRINYGDDIFIIETYPDGRNGYFPGQTSSDIVKYLKRKQIDLEAAKDKSPEPAKPEKKEGKSTDETIRKAKEI